MMKTTAQFAAVIFMIIPTVLLGAQSPVAVHVPSQFASAKTVFLGAAGTAYFGPYAQEITAMTYATMYRDVAAIGKYSLVASPPEAELSMEASVVEAGPDSSFLQLVIRDTKTHALLWTIDEYLTQGFSEKTYQKTLDGAAAKIILDLNSLIAGSIPNAPAAPLTKSRFGQEKP